MLKDLQNCDLLEVYAKDDDSKFNVGQLLSFDNDWLFLLCIDTYGEFDGYMLLYRENVFKINYETKYLKDLAPQVQISKQAIEERINTNNNLLSETLKLVPDGYIVSIILLNGNVIIGKICCKQDKFLKIKSYTDNGCEDGYTIITTDMISSIQFKNRECLEIQRNITSLLKTARGGN